MAVFTDIDEFLIAKAAFDRGEMTATESDEFVDAYKDYAKECAKEREAFDQASTRKELEAAFIQRRKRITAKKALERYGQPEPIEPLCGESPATEVMDALKRAEDEMKALTCVPMPKPTQKIKKVIHCYQVFNKDGSVEVRRSDNDEVVIWSPPQPEIPANAKDNPALFDALNSIEPNPEHGMRSNLSKWS